MLKHYNLNYQAYNAKYFYYDYFVSSPNDLTNCIKRGNNNWDIWKEFYGIDLSFINRNESTDFFKIILESSNYKSVVVNIDPFYCYWSPFYQKAHYFHLLLIINVSNDKYKCFDVYYNTVGYIEVDRNIIEENYSKYFVFNLNCDHEFNIEILLTRIKKLLCNFNYNLKAKKNEIFDYIISNCRTAFFSDNLGTSSLLMHLLWISEDKKHFPIALKYIEENLNKSLFSEVYELFLNSSSNFKLLKSILTKYALTGVLKEKNVSNILDNVFMNDMLIIEKMKRSLANII